MSARIPVINDWGVCLHPSDRYRAPELGLRYLVTGIVTGHPSGYNGPITTGTIRKLSRGVISTNRSRYRLGTVDPAFVAMLTERGLSPDPLRQVRMAVRAAAHGLPVTPLGDATGDLGDLP